MPSDPQQWININDFTPGIFDRISAPNRLPPGAADGAQTYDCIALPGGALAPLPKLTATRTRDHTSILTPSDTSVRISGFHVSGPVQPNNYATKYPGVDNVEVHFAYEAASSAPVHKWFWERVRLWESSPTQETVRDFTVTHHGSWVLADLTYRATAFVDHRMHATDAAAIGDIFVVAGWAPDDMQATENIWLIFPDPDAPTTLSYEAIRTDNEVSALVAHQGRVVSLDRHVFQHGNSGYWITNDQFLWTQVNLRTSATAQSGVFTQGPISGYGAIGSVSAQELIAVKHRGGAITISGDIDDPTVYSLPGVVPTGGSLSYGVYTPVGFIYAVKDGGVHAWGGGDSSTKLSEMLDDDFYDIKPSDWRDFYGKFELWKNWVVTPNNYIFDTILNSWWRISPTTPCFQWAVSPHNNFLYGVPVSFTSGGAVMYTFDLDTKASVYRWQSNYFAPTIDRTINVREMTLRAVRSTGANETVTVTLLDQAGVTEAHVVTLDNVDFPKLYRINTAFQGQGVKLRIDASGGANPAPTVYEVNLGFDEVRRLGRTI